MMGSSSDSTNFLMATICPVSLFLHLNTTPYEPSPIFPIFSYFSIFGLNRKKRRWGVKSLLFPARTWCLFMKDKGKERGDSEPAGGQRRKGHNRCDGYFYLKKQQKKIIWANSPKGPHQLSVLNQRVVNFRSEALHAFKPITNNLHTCLLTHCWRKHLQFKVSLAIFPQGF